MSCSISATHVTNIVRRHPLDQTKQPTRSGTNWPIDQDSHPPTNSKTLTGLKDTTWSPKSVTRVSHPGQSFKSTHGCFRQSSPTNCVDQQHSDPAQNRPIVSSATQFPGVFTATSNREPTCTQGQQAVLSNGRSPDFAPAMRGQSAQDTHRSEKNSKPTRARFFRTPHTQSEPTHPIRIQRNWILTIRNQRRPPTCHGQRPLTDPQRNRNSTPSRESPDLYA